MNINVELRELAKKIKSDKIKYLLLPLIIFTIIILLLLYLSKDSNKTFPDKVNEKINVDLPSVGTALEDEQINNSKFSVVASNDSTGILTDDMSEERVSDKEIRATLVNNNREQLTDLLNKMKNRKESKKTRSRQDIRDSLKFVRDQQRFEREHELRLAEIERESHQDSLALMLASGHSFKKPKQEKKQEIDYSRVSSEGIFNSSQSTNETMINAIIMGDHKDIVDEALVKMRVTNNVKDMNLAKNSIIYAQAKFNGSRLDLSVNAMVNKGVIIKHDLEVYDYDGGKGINIPSDVKNEIKQGLIQEATQGLSIELPIIGTFATKFGNAKVRIIRVDIADAYKVYLKTKN